MSKPTKTTTVLDESKHSQEKIADPAKIHFLADEVRWVRNVWTKNESPRGLVPPSTPNSEYAFGDTFRPLPRPFPDLTRLKVPYIREKGVKCCIEELGKFFNCNDYRFNLLQFWFLDIITDCLWRAQDDFNLPENLQKIVLTWVLYFIDLLRDPSKNISRKEFLTIFKEAILIAAEVIDEGCDVIPSPEKIFALIEEETRSQTSFNPQSTPSSIDISSNDYDNISCIHLEVNNKPRVYELPKEACTCSHYDLSSVNSPTESGISTNASQKEGQEAIEDIDFYQPDPSIPARFLPLPEEIEGEFCEEEEEEEEEDGPKNIVQEETVCKIEDVDIMKSMSSGSQTQTEDSYGVQEVSEKYSIKFDSATSSEETEDSAKDVTMPQRASAPKIEPRGSFRRASVNTSNDNEILKGLAFQKMWEERLMDMANPRKGWVPIGDDVIQEQQIVEDNTAEEEIEEDDDELIEDDNDEEWVDVILKERKKETTDVEDQQVVNVGVLWAISDFIFKYFYESFQFKLVKLAFLATPDLITQRVNRDWKVPKMIKTPFQRPKAEKPKKPAKQKKEKPAKKEKVTKKGAGKKDKKRDKKPKKEKKDDKSKKPAELTQEEKAELERQRQEQKRMEEEMRIKEENKRFMFPLADAATDDLFQGIFEDWVKVDLSKVKKGKKARKKK